MGRRGKSIVTLVSALTALALLGGCSTTRGVPELQREASIESAVPVEADTLPADGAEDRGEAGMRGAGRPRPDVSMEAPIPRASPADPPAAATLVELRNGFHLSADTGWLILPVPRIRDDIEPTYPDHVADPGSGVRLFLPDPGDEPVIRTVPTARAVAERPTVAVTRGIRGEPVLNEPDVPDAPDAENARQAPAVSRVSQAPARPATDLPGGQSSGGVESVESGIGVDRQSPIASRAADPLVSGTEESHGPMGADTAVRTAAATVTAPRTEWTQRRATVDDRSDVTVVLPGTGWFYVGSEYGEGEARFLRKNNDGGDDAFVFGLSGPGEYGLWFQREDPTVGTVSNERLQIRAEEGGPARIAVGGLPEVPSTAVADAGTLADREAKPEADAPAAPLTATGMDAARVGEGPGAATADGTGDGIDGATDVGAQGWLLQARNAAETGDIPTAVEYFRRAIAAGGVASDGARDELFRLAETSGDIAALGAAEEELRTAGEFTPDYVRRAAEITESAGRFGRAAAYYEELIGSAPHDSGLDTIYFRLATILEQPGPSRDLHRALSLFQTIVDDYPLSARWEDSAAEIAYLKRHFIDIR